MTTLPIFLNSPERIAASKEWSFSLETPFSSAEAFGKSSSEAVCAAAASAAIKANIKIG
jgi:mevalonate pyrophosphate decarboxylase